MIDSWTSEGMVWTLDSLKHNFANTRYWEALTKAANERADVIGNGDEFRAPVAGELLVAPGVLPWLVKETSGGALVVHSQHGGWLDHRSPVSAGDSAFGVPWTLAELLDDIGDPIITGAAFENYSMPTPEYMMLCYEIINRLKWRYRRENFGRLDAGAFSQLGDGQSHASYAAALSIAESDYDGDTPDNGVAGPPSIGQYVFSGAKFGFTYNVEFRTEAGNFYSSSWANATGFDREVDYYFVPEKWNAASDYDCPAGHTEDVLNAVELSLSCPDGETGDYEFDLGLDAYPRHTGYATEPADPSSKGWGSWGYGEASSPHSDPDGFFGPYGIYRYDVTDGFQFQT